MLGLSLSNLSPNSSPILSPPPPTQMRLQWEREIAEIGPFSLHEQKHLSLVQDLLPPNYFYKRDSRFWIPFSDMFVSAILE